MESDVDYLHKLKKALTPLNSCQLQFFLQYDRPVGVASSGYLIIFDVDGSSRI